MGYQVAADIAPECWAPRGAARRRGTKSPGAESCWARTPAWSNVPDPPNCLRGVGGRARLDPSRARSVPRPPTGRTLGIFHPEEILDEVVRVVRARVHHHEAKVALDTIRRRILVAPRITIPCHTHSVSHRLHLDAAATGNRVGGSGSELTVDVVRGRPDQRARQSGLVDSCHRIRHTKRKVDFSCGRLACIKGEISKKQTASRV